LSRLATNDGQIEPTFYPADRGTDRQEVPHAGSANRVRPDPYQTTST
jgi:hypothetical protein